MNEHSELPALKIQFLDLDLQKRLRELPLTNLEAFRKERGQIEQIQELRWLVRQNGPFQA